jgi:acyl-CoA reductase-like NAD-dependent aldehyde dehydrogenase
MTDPNAGLAAFTLPGAAEAMHNDIEEKLKQPGVAEVSAKYRGGDRLVKHERCDYLRPTVLHCDSPEPALANTEYMFPFVSVVRCPQADMIKKIGTTLVGSAITKDEKWSQQLVDATNIDRLNVGAVKTIALNWLQPHEGNIIDFLFRARAFQNSPPPAH